MTNAALPQPQYPPPPLPVPFVPTAGYHIAALESESARVKKMTEGKDLYKREFVDKKDAYKDALFPKPGPQERLLLFNRKPLDVWIEQRWKRPPSFEAQINDWVKLEPVSPARDRMLAEMPRRELELEMQHAQVQMEAQAMAQQQAMEQAQK